MEVRPPFATKGICRADDARHRDPTKRSINLAISHRGLSALKAVGLDTTVLQGCIRMPCRAIHDGGKVTAQPYGREGDAIFSASRSCLLYTSDAADE